MNKSCIRLLLTLVMFALLPGTLAQAAQNVTVTLPDFPITLNGISIDNAYRTYPFVVYKDVTYCPMTFYDSRFLGLETGLDNEKRLTIDTTDVVCGLQEDKSNKRNAKIATAYIADYPILVNGQLINNAVEDYPILAMHDVTYFPLSWSYAKVAFKWDYYYDDSTGLAINSKNEVMLPKAIPHFINNGKMVYNPEILLDNGQLYYGGEDGGIYRVSLDNLSEPQKLIQKEKQESEIDGPFYWTSKLKDMGRYVLVSSQGVLIDKQTADVKKIKDDIFSEYEICDINVATFEGKLFYVDSSRLDPNDGQHIEPGNLYVEQNDGKRAQIGDTRYIYGQISYSQPYFHGLSPNDAIDFADNAIYIVAAKPGYPEQIGGTLCKIDLATNKTTELYHTNGDSIWEWVIDGDDLYYLVENEEDGDEWATYSLFVRSLKDGNTTKVSAVDNMTDIRDLEKVGETVYFSGFGPDWGRRTLQNPKQPIDLYGFRAYNPIEDEYSRWVDQHLEIYESHGYLIYCMLNRMGRDPSTDYRTIIFDPKGQMVFRSADIVQNATVDQLGNVAYTIEGQPNIYFGHIENRGVDRDISE